MASVPFILVTGFLGSGKTTFVQRFLDCYADSLTVAVIQNEFATAGVDGVELKRSGKPFHLMEINRGSVFCVCLVADFVQSLTALVDDLHPDVILLEATGLADPIAIGELLNAPEAAARVHLSQICCIVDAAHFMRMKDYLVRIVNQVRVADRVIINKRDVHPEGVPAVQAAIRKINPLALITHTSFCRIPLQDMLSAEKERLAYGPASVPPQPSARPDIGSAVVRTFKKMARETLLNFIEEYRTALMRLKGYVLLEDGTTAAVQSSFDTTTIQEIADYSGASQLVAMGPGLDARVFSRKFHAMLK